VPVTLKLRLGWDEGSLNAPLLASRAENAGVKMVTVHGRTRCQFYQGKADWRAIAHIKQAVSVPVVANGDVSNPFDAATILEESGADAVMIGRAHYGAPWLAGSIAAAAGSSAVPSQPESLADYIIAHYEDMLSLYGIESGLRQARKHLGWYLDRHAPAISADQRKPILTSFEPAQVIALMREAFAPEAQGLRNAA
jgi:tRNA-dihydrouridine synthase